MPLSELMTGPRGTLMCLGALTAVIGILVAALRSGWLANRRRPLAIGEMNTVEGTPGYRRYVLAAVGGGTQQSWDHTVRPVLADLAMFTSLNARLGQSDGLEATRELLGGPLFEYVDPTVRPCRDSSRPGPTRAELLRVLERLESAHG